MMVDLSKSSSPECGEGTLALANKLLAVLESSEKLFGPGGIAEDAPLLAEIRTFIEGKLSPDGASTRHTPSDAGSTVCNKTPYNQGRGGEG